MPLAKIMSERIDQMRLCVPQKYLFIKIILIIFKIYIRSLKNVEKLRQAWGLLGDALLDMSIHDARWERDIERLHYTMDNQTGDWFDSDKT